jgi:hypothetical protein
MATRVYIDPRRFKEEVRVWLVPTSPNEPLDYSTLESLSRVF